MSRYNHQIDRRYNQQYSVNKKPYFVVTCIALVIMIILLTCAIIVTRSDYKESQTLLVDSSSEPIIENSSVADVSSSVSETSAFESEASTSSTTASKAESKSEVSSNSTSNSKFIKVIENYSVYNFVGQTGDWRLRLANRLNKIDDYTPPTKYIGTKYCRNNDNYKIDERVYDDLIAMMDAAAEDGVKLIVVSAYRSYERQTNNYNNKVNYYINKGYSRKDAENKASTIIAIPGTSDHNLGLAIDFNYLEEKYENRPELVWLREHAEEYGFVMRYKKEKGNYTGIIYEPWHYRYVGKEHAKKMNQLNMCLEEYVEYLLKNS